MSDTPTLHLNLLGTIQIQLNEKPVSLRRAKEQALLVYLAVTGQPHSRDLLVDLLWSEMEQNKARRNLTATLSGMRKELPDFLIVDSTSVAIDPNASIAVDILDCQKLLAERNVKDERSKVRQAVALYQGEFLTGFVVKDAFVFEEWVYIERERIREQVMKGMELLIADAIRWEDWASGVEYATQLLAIEPWRESAHRQLMQLHAYAGRRTAALAQFELCKEILQEELAVEPSPETVALFERLQADQIAPPHNLPAQSNAFLGRTRELDQIHAHMENADCRLLTITGPGGIGKTRLAIEAVRRYIEASASFAAADFADGIYFVSLASIQAEGYGHNNVLAPAIADAVGFSFQERGDLQGQLNHYLQTKSVLLVCDNIEHLLLGPSQRAVLGSLQSILQHAHHAKLLITSRQRLNIQEEWVLLVDGLAYPTEPTVDLETIASDAFPAVALFLRRAEQAQIGFTLEDKEVPHVVKLCQQLEGMPLGLELAAHWLRNMSPAEIVEELESGLDILIATIHDVPDRHRSMRAVFDYSWRMLTPEMQLILRKLSIFHGGFTRKAAKEVANASIGMLVSLLDQSLIQAVEEGRYTIHELLRQFSAEQLMNNVETAEVERRHGQYFLSLVSELREELFGREPQRALNMLRNEIDNIRQAWRWAVNANSIGDIEASTTGLVRLHDMAGLFVEGEDLLRYASGQLSNSENFLLPNSNKVLQKTLTRLLVGESALLNRRGLTEQATPIALRAVALADTTDDAGLRAMSHHEHGVTLTAKHDYVYAHQESLLALQLARKAQLPNVEGDALCQLGVIASHQDDYGTALENYQKALQCFRNCGDQRGESLVLADLSSVYRMQGCSRKADTARRDALQGQFEEAESVCREGIEICRRISYREGEAWLVSKLAHLFLWLGAFEQAQLHFADCYALWQDLEMSPSTGGTLIGMANLSLYQGRLDEALAYAERGAEDTQVSHASFLQAGALVTKGDILFTLNRLNEAEDSYQRALSLHRELNQEHMMPSCQAKLVQIQLARGDVESAFINIEPVLAALEDGYLKGSGNRFSIYLICYQVLDANGDRRAPELLKTACQQLHEYAANIHDDKLRTSLLENIPDHRKLNQLGLMFEKA
ncbi:hypothetical protein KFU94_39250 [Chloroflexi bacterium TSY]|nr:hypothetical protein [Chloroflexi bacterium TSY]